MKDRVFNRITVDDLAESGTRVVTIATAKVVSFSKDYLSDADRKVVLTFKETGDKEFVVNATSFHLLADRYSNDKANGFASWIGKSVVLTKVETDNPQNGEKVAAVWVARPKEWDQAIREDVSTARRGRAPRKRSAK
jgi:hypothetical protein